MKIGKLKVGQLRKELQSRGLDTSGTRPALMKRLKEALEAAENAPEKPAEAAEEVAQQKTEAARTEEETGQAAAAAEQAAAVDQAVPEETIVEGGASEGVPAEKVEEQEGGKAIATGSLVRASEESMDERLRKRRERFGIVERAKTEGKGKTRETEEERKFEEAKKRRAEKFGTAEEGEEGISKEERERRLKRQRRFQSIGNATAV